MKKNGFSIVEILVTIFIFCLVGTAVYTTFDALVKLSRKNSVRVNALAIINEQIETIRNLPYDSVGVAGGIPNGVLQSSKIINKNNIDYTVNFTVRNIDDPFDGLIGGSPADPSAAPDYKKVELEINCANCPNNPSIILSTNVARKGLEMSSSNGALFVRVLNSSGNPVSQASVHITNNDVSPSIDMTDSTDNDGYLRIIDVPPSDENYHVLVTKSGYTSAMTLARTPENPNPTDTDLSVSAQQITSKTLYIDFVSTLNIATVNQACAAIGNIALNLKGSDLIGVSPDALRYDHDFSTSGAGILSLGDMKWDTYTPSINSVTYDLAGMIPLLPINLLPGASQSYKFVMASASSNNLLITIKDSSGVLLSGAAVHLYKTGYDQTLTTGRGYIVNSDWSGGSGQEDYINLTKYFSDDGNIDTITSPGNLTLKIDPGTGRYSTSGYLISSTFDTGDATNFVSLWWSPLAQAPGTGPDSVKFQIATNNDHLTWDFVGPDGTGDSYYTVTNFNINGHDSQRYIRYKIFISTADDQISPLISDVSLGFTQNCAPPGQAFFSALSNDTYSLQVDLAGYQTFLDQVDVVGNSTKEIILSP